MYNLKNQPATNFKRYGEKREYPMDSIQIHTIGAGQNTATTVRDNMNVYSPAYGIVHAIVDADANTPNDVLQILPDDNVSWADAGYGNHHSFTIEIMESDYMQYNEEGTAFAITDMDKFRADVKKGYNVAVEYVADLCKKFGFDPEEKLPNGLHRVYSHNEGRLLALSSGHVDPTHIWSKVGYTMDGFRRDVKDHMTFSAPQNKTKATEVNNLTNEPAKAERLLAVCRPIAEKYGLLPSVCTAQTILESGYCSTDLAIEANNVCGLKTSLSGNTWEGSTWDGFSKYTKKTAEQDKFGNEYYVNADFRRYSCIEDSIADRCAYLLGAMNGDKLRYAGIEACKNYTDQITLIKKGQYATDVNYVSKICSIIERFDLARYDGKTSKKENTTYKVQVGAFENSGNAANLLIKVKEAEAYVDGKKVRPFQDSYVRYDEAEEYPYRVQIGSYSDYKNAQARLNLIKSVEVIKDGKTVHPFSDAFIKTYR